MTSWSAALPAEVRRHQGRRAGLVSRGIAAFLDAGVAALGVAGCYLVWAALLFTVDPVRFTMPVPARPVVVTAALVLATAYLTLCWTATGRTVGGLVLGLRVVDGRGGLLRGRRAAVRAVCCVALPLGLLWVLWDVRRRSVQDVLLRTVVVYDWDPRPPDVHSPAAAFRYSRNSGGHPPGKFPDAVHGVHSHPECLERAQDPRNALLVGHRAEHDRVRRNGHDEHAPEIVGHRTHLFGNSAAAAEDVIRAGRRSTVDRARAAHRFLVSRPA
jgi:uncharacterized RDD family membrane protein YckC